MTVDFGRTAGDYAAYRASFPEEFFSRLTAMNVGLRGQRVVDLGTGTGSLARGFARRGCIVTGLDPAKAMLDQARRLDAEVGVRVTYRVGRAEDTELDARRWDVVSAGQCWHWFDRPRAGNEARRLLVAGGALVICHMDYLPLAGNVCAATESLILEHNPSWTMAGGTGIHADWTLDAAEAGFTGLETFSFDVAVPQRPTVGSLQPPPYGHVFDPKRDYLSVWGVWSRDSRISGRVRLGQERRQVRGAQK